MSRARRGATQLNGLLAVDKPAGMTSHDVIDRLRRLTGEGRIGHAGTLDPMATGLLLVCLGPATKRSAQLMGHDKTYAATVAFGSATTTDDFCGEVLAVAPVPDCLGNVEFARQLLQRFEGEQMQLPPQYAAIKRGGVKAYELARAGQPVELEPRPVLIRKLELLSLDAGSWQILAQVSKGTYIRALARDLGLAAGTRAHLAALRRLRIGQVGIEQAHSLEELSAAIAAAGSPEAALADLWLDL